jgi:hypothetical protein
MELGAGTARFHDGALSGAVTDSSARVVARPEDPQARLRLAVDRSAN